MTAPSLIPAQPPQLLPPVRKDLEYFAAPPEEDGSPVWMIRDPLHSTFVRATWEQMEIIKRLSAPISPEALIADLTQHSSVRLVKEEVLAFCQSLIGNGLTVRSLHRNPAELQQEFRSRQTGLLFWLLRNYLYFRVPLLYPDAFLERTLPTVRHLVSLPFRLTALLVSFLGLFMLAAHFSEYIHTIPSFISVRGAFLYGLAITLVKVIHEFSHAYVAKAMKTRVKAMGVAFMVMWPVPYCDVTDSWRMSDRRKRLLISSAGVLAELTIAGFSLFLWGVFPDGTAKSIFFVLSSVTLLSALLVNLNPGMRFDGYYIFSDLFGIDNLQDRAFSMTKWHLRRLMWKINVPCPEPSATLKRRITMIVYSLYAWQYRFFLYLGIAVMVYHAVTPVLGIILFALEIGMFLVRPAINEVKAMTRLRKHIPLSIRGFVTAGLLLFLLYWFFVPQSHQRHLPAITSSQREQFVYSPYAGVARDVIGGRGTPVREGEILLRVESPELQAKLTQARLSKEYIEQEISVLSLDPLGKRMLPQKRVELDRTKARIRGLEEQLTRNRLKAQLDGVIVSWTETTVDGVALYQGEMVGRVVDEENMTLIAYIPERLAGELTGGESGVFVPASELTRFAVRITRVRPLRVEYLEHPALASTAGGEIEVNFKNDRLEMVKPYYAVEVALNPADMNRLRIGQVGQLYFESPPTSLASEVLSHAYRVILRESNL